MHDNIALRSIIMQYGKKLTRYQIFPDLQAADSKELSFWNPASALHKYTLGEI